MTSPTVEYAVNAREGALDDAKETVPCRRISRLDAPTSMPYAPLSAQNSCRIGS